MTFEGKKLTENVDYNIIYDGSSEIGDALVLIVGKGDYYNLSYAPYTIRCGHSFELVSETEANCTEKGSKKYICSVCSEEKTEETETPAELTDGAENAPEQTEGKKKYKKKKK